MLPQSELTINRFVVQEDGTIKRWSDINSTKQQQLMQTWSNAAMEDAGYKEQKVRG